jgi:glycosyltransferase involved in cell wall biosynthesis
MLLTISNLYPRPDEAQRGLFNAQLFNAMSGRCALSNICLVPEKNFLRHKDICVWPDAYERELNTAYLPYFYLPIVGRNLSWLNCRNALLKKDTLFDKCDVILATWLYPDCVAAVELAKKNKKKIWLKVHGTDRFHLENKVRRRVILNACEYVEGIICNAEFMRNELVQLGLPAEKIWVISNGVDTELFCCREKDAAEEQLRGEGREIAGHLLDAQSPIVLFVGHLVDIKGGDLLLKAWSELRKGRDDGYLVMIGEGMRRKQWELLADELGIGESVIFMGECMHKEIALWMNIADCLCLSSRSEGMPNVVIEALVSGLPVVATDVGDCRAVLGSDSATRVVPVEDYKALASGISGLLEADIDRQELARSREERFSWDKCAEEHLNMIK